MDLLNDFIAFHNEQSFLVGVLIAAACAVFLYVVLKKRAELSEHAIDNTVTSLCVVAINVVFFVLFLGDADDLFQAAYDALGAPTLDKSFWDGVPFALTCVIGLAVKDFADYWNHRFMHTRWGWPTHAAHHSDTHVNGFTTFRIHFLESLVMTMSYVILLTWLQLPETIPFLIFFAAVHNIYVHLDLDIEHGPLKYLIASPRFHRWHHADLPAAYGKNLANVMPIYDLIFGTYYAPGPCREKMGALDTDVADKDFVAIIAYPFMEWARLIREERAKRAAARSAEQRAAPSRSAAQS